MDWHWLWLTVAAFVAGVLNAVAGGGSFLLFPAMLSMKMLPIQANATNTVALWPGQLSSVAAYRRDIRRNLRVALPMGMAGLLGGTAGAIVLLITPQLTFLHLVPWLLLAAAIIFAASGPVSRWLERLNVARHADAAGRTHAPRRLPVFLATIVVSFYIGYFGAGAGIPAYHAAFALRLSGHSRDQRAEGGLSHPGKRHRLCHLCGERPGYLALLPAGHGHFRHWRLHIRQHGSQSAAVGAARFCRFPRPLHGRMVLLEKSLSV